MVKTRYNMKHWVSVSEVEMSAEPLQTHKGPIQGALEVTELYSPHKGQCQWAIVAKY